MRIHHGTYLEYPGYYNPSMGYNPSAYEDDSPNNLQCFWLVADNAGLLFLCTNRYIRKVPMPVHGSRKIHRKTLDVFASDEVFRKWYHKKPHGKSCNLV